jgi:hypothetical protein
MRTSVLSFPRGKFNKFMTVVFYKYNEFICSQLRSENKALKNVVMS